MASLAHAVTNNLFVLQALRSQMQKQRSWWLLRRSYSTSQTRKTFMSNLLCSTPQRQVTTRPSFLSLVTCCCVGAQFIFLCAHIGSPPPHPPNTKFLWSRWAPNSFLLHQLLCPLWRRWLQLSRVWLYLNEHVQASLEIKKNFNIKQDYITGLIYCSYFSFTLWSHVQFVVNRSIKTHAVHFCVCCYSASGPNQKEHFL